MLTVDVSQEETELSGKMFKRLDAVPLIDKYEAYQLLDDDWNRIEVDLEIVQTEGFEVTKKVDPNMVTKKKDGRDQEVQDGWSGRVIPFNLVQETLLHKELKKLKQKENRLTEITAEYEEILDSLSEEDKETDALNEKRDGFAAAGVAKEAKQIRADLKKNETLAVDSYEAMLLNVDALLNEEKELRRQVNTDNAALHLRTKETIENLTDKQVYELLELKWITPLVTSLHRLPENVITTLAAKIQALADKYATTYMEVVEQIHETENSLSSLISELTGSDYDMKGLGEFQQLLKGE